MTTPTESPAVVPLLHRGVLILAPGSEGATLRDARGTAYALHPVGESGRHVVEPVPSGDLEIVLPGAAPVAIQIGGCFGAVENSWGGLVTGWARNDRRPGEDVEVIAVGPEGIVARATARAGQGGRFVMTLPAAATRSGRRLQLALGVAGSDCLLDGGHVVCGGDEAPAAQAPAPMVLPRPHLGTGPAIRIKIATPNLKEAPLWGDYHFANSLAASFERLGLQAGVDTLDAWYSPTVAEDVVLTIRGRQRIELDPGKVNVMWLISHPDRIEDEEYAEYAHVAVASDIYAAQLRARGVASVSVLHQATDARLFGARDLATDRKPASLFVGNSRREYRTMVKWCRQKDIPLELYGGGWEGILPDDAVRAPSVANADLPSLYASHLLLLNDHWDSMRDNGFLSNRLFDGSATGTPILTDPVAGLSDIFGDTIATASEPEGFAAQIRDCLADPAPWLARAERARGIVLGAHTFDHRARTLAALFERIALAK